MITDPDFNRILDQETRSRFGREITKDARPLMTACKLKRKAGDPDHDYELTAAGVAKLRKLQARRRAKMNKKASLTTDDDVSTPCRKRARVGCF